MKKIKTLGKYFLFASLTFVSMVIALTSYFSWKYYRTVLKEDEKVKIIVAANNEGQLCNQLWHFARLAAFCQERNYELFNPAFFHYAKHFENFQHDLAISPTKPIKIYVPFIMQELQRRCYRIISHLLKNHFLQNRFYCTGPEPLILSPTNPDFPQLAFGNYFFFDWYFTNPAGLEKHREYILELLKPKKEYQRRIDQFWQTIDKSRLTVGVHIRHGDFRYYKKGEFFFTLDEIKEQMLEIVKRYENLNPQFLIFSNEMRSKNEFSGFDVVIGTGDVIEDLYSLSKCDVILGTSASTYNLWAAWYGNIPRIELGKTPDWERLDKILLASQKAVR